MKPFLKIVAEDLYNVTDGNFENVTIIFPNKRASLFFNQYLAELNGKRPMWLPKYVTISEMFSNLSSLTIADHILLICLLYKSYVKVTNSDDTLDKFFAWGEIMLQDFNDIDNNMIPANKLFANIEDLDDMTNFSFLTESQIEAIRIYFENFDPQNNTKLKEKFGSFWSMILPIYNDFKEELANMGYAYDGMLKRNVADELNGYSSAHPQIPSNHIYAVVGFNVLNKTEQVFFSYLNKYHNTYFYWDYDHSYMPSSKSASFEAGQFISKNILKYGDRLATNHTERSNMHSKRQISVISASTENAQARYTAQWLPQVIDSKHPFNETAVILCNENLLQPIIHSIPKEIQLADGKERTILSNITMGHPLSQTSIASFIDALLDVQLKGMTRNNNTWHHIPVCRLLNHPFTSRITDGCSVKIARIIKSKERVYPTTKEITNNNQVLLNIFELQHSNSQLLTYLSSIVEALGKTFNSPGGTDINDFTSQLNIESIYITHKLINRLNTLYETGYLNVRPTTLAKLLRQLIASKSIPFHGEPATGVQIMGMLETRNLDFKNILILSANEGNIPPTPTITSLIPYTLREAYGLSTIEKQNSLYAYYFYRLIQRADNIQILYNSSTEGFGSNGEMSRFITQFLVDANMLLSSDTQINTYSIQSPSTPMECKDICAQKSNSTLVKLNNLYNTSTSDKASTLTPSTINTYIDCPLKFYFSKLSPIPLNPDNVVDEDIDNALFGNIIHSVLERIYKPFIGKTLDELQLKAIADNIAKIRQYVDEEISEAFHPGRKENPRLTGQQLLNRNVIIDYIRRQLNIDVKACPLKILKLENKEHTLSFNITPDTTIRLGGIIDRMDMTNIEGNNTIRIIDYKTSASPHTTKDIATLFNSKIPHRPYHIFQALTYTLIVASLNDTDIPVSPSLFYVKKTQNTAPIDSVIKIDKTPILKFASIENPDETTQDFVEHLHKTLNTLFDPQMTFCQTENTDICKYCDFKQICTTISRK